MARISRLLTTPTREHTNVRRDGEEGGGAELSLEKNNLHLLPATFFLSLLHVCVRIVAGAAVAAVVAQK